MTYLDDVKIPKLDAEVELLIGTNAPKLLEPSEIISGEDQGPYAVKTLLRWVINGFVKEADDGWKIGFQSVTANRISVSKLEELLVAQYNHDFSEKTSDDDFKISREDQRFMEIMDQSISIENGHYCIDLPFRKDDVIMPNNRCLVGQRLMNLKGSSLGTRSFKGSTWLFSQILSIRGMLKQYHKISYFGMMVKCGISHITGYTILKRRLLELCLTVVQFSKECP